MLKWVRLGGGAAILDSSEKKSEANQAQQVHPGVMTELEPCVVLVTCPDADVAGTIARACVTDRLAACVNIVPGLTSVYRWEGNVEEDRELLLMIKTHRGRLEALKGRVMALHPYTVPEFLVLPVVAGSREYLGWMADLLLTP